MNMKRTFLSAILFCICALVSADSYLYLTVNSSGEDKSYEISSISKITFDADNMILWGTNSSKLGELPLASLSKMAFTSTAAGIAAMELQSNITLEGGVLRVKADEGSRITLYNIKGESVSTITASAAETDINLSGLRKGVYIVKVNNEAKKVMNR